MNHLIDEKKLSLKELATREGVHVSTVWRWVLRGVRGVRLESFSAGARRYTTDEAWIRFCEATTAAAQGEVNQVDSRTNRQREASISAAERDMSAAGA